MEAVLCAISYILYWGMNIQNSNNTSATSKCLYDILLLTNSTILTAHMISLYAKNPVPNSWFLFPFPEKNAQVPLFQIHP
jgi:hypothetical protein